MLPSMISFIRSDDSQLAKEIMTTATSNVNSNSKLQESMQTDEKKVEIEKEKESTFLFGESDANVCSARLMYVLVAADNNVNSNLLLFYRNYLN